MMTPSIASIDPWPLPAPETTGTLDPPLRAPNALATRTTPGRSILGLFDDAVLLLLVALLFPVAILLLGMPIALLVRLVAAMAPGL
jgi:hypothetical protein